ncbi:MAG: hypothetical protein M1822_002369 [Bathelium mastoideum]|nr:MAG: hypothetical protein M1822_002369 [Bathelium mastoideum]
MPTLGEILAFLRAQIFVTPPVPTANFVDKTVIITGGNTGLGFEAAKHLIRLHVSHLIIACRSSTKGATAQSQLEAYASSLRPSTIATVPQIEVWSLDLCSFASVRSLARRASSLPRLDAVLLNAGVDTLDFSLAENVESTLTVNVVSTFLLAFLLLPKVRQSSRKSGEMGYITVVGSSVHIFADHTQISSALVLSHKEKDGDMWDFLSEEKTVDMKGRYYLSKLPVMFGVRELASRIARENGKGEGEIVVNCVNPGWCRTELFRTNDGGAAARVMLRLIGRTAEEGSRTLVHALSAGRESQGEFLGECRVKEPSVFVKGEEGRKMQRDVWEHLVGRLERAEPGCTKSL